MAHSLTHNDLIGAVSLAKRNASMTSATDTRHFGETSQHPTNILCRWSGQFLVSPELHVSMSFNHETQHVGIFLQLKGSP